jgi:NAD(P)-dependent dehydrogenase (short-subunit alcohol dehydrogenase family)
MADDDRVTLSAAAPLVRGLLSEETGDPDRPRRLVILRSLASPAALDFAAAADAAAEFPEPLTRGPKPPLFIPSAGSCGTAGELRSRIAGRISEYSARHKVPPAVVCLEGLGVLYVESGDYAADLALSRTVAVVTGAAGAIGRGVCEALLEAGCCVAATDVNAGGLAALEGDLRAAAGDRAAAEIMDVTGEESVRSAFDRIVSRWGGIDIAVVNAGIAAVSSLIDLDLETFRRLERVNVEGALITIRRSADLMRCQATGGDIILVSTKNVAAPGAGFGAYSATKAAAHQLGRIASIELARYGIRVNMVAPDAVFGDERTPSGLWAEIGPDRMKAKGLTAEQLRGHYRDRNLLKAEVTARHVANAVIFFATHATPATGVTMPVDGGLPDAAPR